MSTTLFTNARLVLDDADHLTEPSQVAVDGNRISYVGADRQAIEADRVIDVGGRTLMPGLIDAHAHITGLSLSPRNVQATPDEIASAAVDYLRATLMDGFTTVREAGGADHRIARRLEQGDIIGPRLFYSGRALTQTGGGADFRTMDESLDPCGHVTPHSVMSVIVDGVDEVRRAAREEFRLGATQLKLFASGGVVFPAKSHATRYEFSIAEMEAAVEESAARDTYVMAHAYSDDAVRRCLQAGVRSIEHANFVTEETVALMGEHRAFFDPTFISLVQRVESAGATGLSESIVHNVTHAIEDGRTVYGWARKHGVPIALGTDLWGPDARRSQLRELALRAELDDAASIVHSATTVNAELLMMAGQLGTIRPHAFADLLVVDGDPLRDVQVLCHPDENLLLVMKDGVIHSDRLAPSHN
ncbi:integrase [Mycobacterium antarcticum]|uniref:metal-dependent hydrolase family protein n=1 Tax=unclassified Mycolicibacterium TaxID=2636767 RepID=UPI0023A11375|nr:MULTISPECIES: amidohydrolase family protein [unclassified Mycolicibacterium]BDX31451.1 integrase [Mycolicibacterium sp. TUM20985]GLP80598.1 integrase [Mycolicibacterium sp. TUM20984]